MKGSVVAHFQPKFRTHPLTSAIRLALYGWHW